ncbi:hypothetical protein L596_017326 [Steinernema carpocapsae]|uniref:Uncharacterized protein n=1 Tax=Steinernema carpocapsae TaxID=34508 RepID=A0A4U5N1A9_STECR|nr:hypothetical protein L596_017326 [Steinernema carpocapsae]
MTDEIDPEESFTLEEKQHSFLFDDPTVIPPFCALIGGIEWTFTYNSPDLFQKCTLKGEKNGSIFWADVVCTIEVPSGLLKSEEINGFCTQSVPLIQPRRETASPTKVSLKIKRIVIYDIGTLPRDNLKFHIQPKNAFNDFYIDIQILMVHSPSFFTHTSTKALLQNIFKEEQQSVVLAVLQRYYGIPWHLKVWFH